ncbi:HlyD family secretion protein [Flavobacterium gelidilacus]|jgi:multidrug resistance efflux pump|uniref:HlyD family secretion protein n=1 Tax=Flavobacterium gelidilacus TaxID=206041 RepID=UPI0003FFE340|nr:HlyD family secretion protein [Flavobacterium gelidilacus]
MPKYQDIELRSEEVQEILTRVPHWMIRWGNIIIVLLLLLMMMFAYFMKYPDILTTQVVITTQNPPEKLVARTTGKIAKILVEDRVEVEPKTPLAIIENTANYKDVFQLIACVDTISINKTQFNFPFEKLNVLQLGEIQNAFTIFEKDYVAYDLNRDLKPYSIEKNAQGLETNQLKERLNLQQQQYQISQNELQLKKQELERYRTLHDKGIIASQEWESKNLDYLQSEKNVKNISSQLSQMHSSINDLNRNSGNTRVNETKDNINLLRNVLQSFNQLKKAINDWELAYVLRSSIKGKVSFMQIWVENQTINSGEQVFTIVPTDNKNYIGKVKAPAQNSGKIKVNQDVNIRLANFPDREFGIIKGKVKSISLTPDKEGNLLIDISLPNGIETSYDKKIIFQQEMSGTADIVTEDLRLIERLLYQFRDIFSRQSETTSSNKNPSSN